MRDGTELRLLTGDSLRLAPGEFIRIALHPYLLAFYALIVAFVFAANSNAERDAVPFALRLFGYGSSVLVGVGVLFLSVGLGQALTRRQTGRAQIHFPIALLVTVASSVLYGETLTPFLYGDPMARPAQIAMKMLFYVLTVQIAAAVMMHLLLPPILSRLRGQRFRGMADLVAYGRAQSSSLRLAGVELDPARLIRMEVEADLVRIITEDGTRIAQEPLSQVLGRLPEGLGLLVHRSDWVAARAVTGVTRIGRSRALRLSNGDVVRVASSRDAEVADWLRQKGLA